MRFNIRVNVNDVGPEISPSPILRYLDCQPDSALAPIIAKSDLDKLKKYPSVRKWLKGKSTRTQYNYLRILARITMQVEDTPEWLINTVRRGGPSALKEILSNTSPEARSPLRSFFRANGISDMNC